MHLLLRHRHSEGYDFDPLRAPTKTVDTGKYEYVIDTENEESKGQ